MSYKFVKDYEIGDFVYRCSSLSYNSKNNKVKKIKNDEEIGIICELPPTTDICDNLLGAYRIFWIQKRQFEYVFSFDLIFSL